MTRTRSNADEYDLSTDPRVEFSRHLRQLLSDRNMTQSDLARAANLGRDSISTYCSGKTLPEPKNLLKIAHALNVTVAELAPNVVTAARLPKLEIRQVEGDDRVYLQINRMVTLEQAARIFEIIRDIE